MSEPIQAFIDIHGHSRKKSVFMYGPHFPLHSERYLKSKVLPKILDEKTQMFRFWSCKFRIEKSKLKTARVVLFKEYGIMNCFTLEASFHGFIDKDRTTTELTTELLEQVGNNLGNSLFDYNEMVEEDSRQKAQIREQLKKKKRKIKARDIAKAIIRSEKQNQVQGAVDETDPEIQSSGSRAGQGLVSSNGLNSNISNIKRFKGVRSRSIQNQNINSSKVSTMSDTQSDGGLTSVTANQKPQMVNNQLGNSQLGNNQLGNPARQGSAKRGSHDNAMKKKNFCTSASQNREKGAKENQGPTEDIMELISEEEMSVCRSEGSPPRKTKKRAMANTQYNGQGNMSREDKNGNYKKVTSVKL